MQLNFGNVKCNDIFFAVKLYLWFLALLSVMTFFLLLS